MKLSLKYIEKSQKQFPSPVGVLHVSIVICHATDFLKDGFRPLSGSYMFLLGMTNYEKYRDEFPSPVGVLHVSIMRYSSEFSSRYAVSVPCRGLTCFYRKESKMLNIETLKFPSPVGVLHVSMYRRV